MDEATERCKERKKGGFKKVTESKKKGSASRQDRVEPLRATSGGAPDCGVVCMQKRAHRLECLGVVFYTAEASERQGGQSKGYWPGSK